MHLPATLMGYRWVGDRVKFDRPKVEVLTMVERRLPRARVKTLLEENRTYLLPGLTLGVLSKPTLRFLRRLAHDRSGTNPSVSRFYPRSGSGITSKSNTGPLVRIRKRDLLEC